MKILKTIALFCGLALVTVSGFAVNAQDKAASPGASITPTPVNNKDQQTQSGEKGEKKDEKKDADKDYREMFDKLLDRATWFFGVIGGIVLLIGTVIWALVKWTLRETREDAKKALQTEMNRRGLDEFETVQRQIAAFNSFKDRRVDWIRPESVVEPSKEIAFLKRAGLQYVSNIPVAVGQVSPMLNDPDLVILSFDGSPQSKDLVKLVVDVLKRSQKEVPVLIYAPLGLRVEPAEMQLLNETALHAIANFPATLVTQALELVRLRQF